MRSCCRLIAVLLGLAMLPAPAGARDPSVRVDRSVLDALGPAPPAPSAPGVQRRPDPPPRSTARQPARQTQPRVTRPAPAAAPADAGAPRQITAPPAPPPPALASPAPTPAPPPPAAPPAASPPAASPPTASPPPAVARAAPPPPPVVATPAPRPMPPPPAASPATPPASPPASLAQPSPGFASPAPAPVVAPLPAAPRAAADAPGRLRIAFTGTETELAPGTRQEVLRFAAAMPDDEAARITVNAYAGGDPADPSRARRTALSRALAVRSALIEGGVRSTRIDVRALGLAAGDGPSDRVDILPGTPR